MTFQVPADDPEALYKDREHVASATKAADIWAARLSANSRDFESAYKLAQARYWLGTNGLPDEGAWYAYKVSQPGVWSGAGLRDVLARRWNTDFYEKTTAQIADKGMLKFEETNRDFRRMWLYYIVRDGAHAPYDEEIRSSYLKADSFIDYTLWDGSARGRIKAADVLKDVAPLDDFAVMLCGSPQFVADLTRQFHAAGVPVERIITEDLLFR